MCILLQTGLMCNEPAVIANGYHDAPSGPFPCGTSVSYFCYWWADLQGFDKMKCTANGKYNRQLPKCVTNSKWLFVSAFLIQAFLLVRNTWIVTNLIVYRMGNSSDHGNWSLFCNHDSRTFWKEVFFKYFEDLFWFREICSLVDILCILSFQYNYKEAVQNDQKFN